MLEWILSLIVTKLIGETLFIGAVMAVSVAASAYFAFAGMRSIAALTFAAGGLLCAFLMGLATAGDAYEIKMQAFRDKLQAAENMEQQRQAAVNELRQKLAAANSMLTVEASQDRERIIREVRTKIVRVASCRWNPDEFARLQRLSQPRRERSGN